MTRYPLFTMPIVFLGFIICQNLHAQSGALRKSESGIVSFISNAPLETIRATSDDLSGVLDVNSNKFAFKIALNSFEGFNNPLQRIHFQENYLETDKYPESTFIGKIVDNVDLTQPGSYHVRAKGRFTVHGITKEEVVKVEIKNNVNRVDVHAKFIVLLKDYDIRIPRIVNQKIASEIEIEVRIQLN